MPKLRFRTRHLALVYLGLLLMSHLWRGWTGEDPPSRAVETGSSTSSTQVRSSLETPKFDAEGQLPGTVQLAYREWDPPGSAPEPTVLLLHGSPGRSGDFEGLGPMLARRGLRAIAPDLPGFGSSSRQVPDYSVLAHARYASDLLDQLGMDSAHLVGFSMGGGVALQMADLAPERVQSITLLSAIGVQEHELLGNYHANHAVHALQLAGLWLLAEATPHFGAFDNLMLSVPYARNFFDTDQRPLRGILESWQGPLLLMHGQNDVLVPVTAALEHHRIVPQSELVLLDANHFLVFRDPGRLAGPLADFLQRAAAGTARIRAEAEPERVEASLRDEVQQGLKAGGFGLVIWMVLLALATLVSEDLTCIAAGLMVAAGRIDFLAAVAACFLGIFIGDMLLYAAGRYLGRPWLGRRPFSWWVKSETLTASREWFEERGSWLIFASRFVPGTRIPTYVSSGLLHMGVGWFALRLFLPLLLWVPLLVFAAQHLGGRLLEPFERFQHLALPALLAVMVGLWLILGLLRSLFTYRGRRLLLGSLRRKLRWEFWPPWVFYPPVVLWVLWLGLRYRGPTLFTAANPGMDAGGGFIGESKAEILARLDPHRVARFRYAAPGLDVEQGMSLLRTFMTEEGLSYPVVIKPDVGQRGSGVCIAHNEEEAAQWLEQRLGAQAKEIGSQGSNTPATGKPGAWIVQEYVPGPELGVFWLRLPSEERGRIFSVTDKRLPRVHGNGVSTVEQLILADARAVAMAPTYLDRLRSRLQEVPAEGESVALAQLGTHCRGAVFLDGQELATPALAAAVEEAAHSYEGFYFGRFDLRGPSREALAAGEFKVLELNGVTSEATHIYDPDNSLMAAYKVLFQQWRLAFEIGHQNRQQGHRPIGLGPLLRLLLAGDTTGS